MTSISTTSNSNYLSPLQQLQAQLQADVNSGAISSSDQSALSSALNDIDASLQAGPASDAGSSTNASPADLQSKIDSLIANEVSSGKLTGDQATELQGVFKQAFASGDTAGAASGPSGAGHAHHGHHGGHGGPPPADNSSSTDSASSAGDILQQFLQSLQDSQSTSSSTPYGATGSLDPGNGSGTSSPPLLINYQS